MVSVCLSGSRQPPVSLPSCILPSPCESLRAASDFLVGVEGIYLAYELATLSTSTSSGENAIPSRDIFHILVLPVVLTSSNAQYRGSRTIKSASMAKFDCRCFFLLFQRHCHVPATSPTRGDSRQTSVAAYTVPGTRPWPSPADSTSWTGWEEAPVFPQDKETRERCILFDNTHTLLL